MSMYLNVFIVTFVAWISFSSAQFTTQEPVDVESNHHDLGPCNEENFGQRKLIKDSDGNETALICSHDNGVYSWKLENAMETEIDDTHDVMEDIILKREAATEFYQRQRDRRSLKALHHECYSECCTWEEVREYFK
ncbi:Hypothetical predicted protein [Paramuricea clavata]|uniref:Uncharacterized protein n=1 Tax=Paramuricea clavata TaxID=317549 RepID=A0A6S7KFJ9_PARCT|nr:Hypothetical predicted protein [Paramuricea clavata]